MVAADKTGMNLKPVFYKFMGRRGFVTFGVLSLLFLSSTVLSEEIIEEYLQVKRPVDLLWEIYEEVAGLKRFANDNFIKGEFHINLDGNTENKEEHIVVLNHFALGQEKMLLQVTYFESRRKNSPVKYAKFIREIECCILEEGVEIERSDYSEVEISSVLPEILEGIRYKKKFLDLIR
ncbi:MAG: hypothetical protein PVI66_11915 [Candidatus Aminicenantes bacterium]|jgi:hypothetical protein